MTVDAPAGDAVALLTVQIERARERAANAVDAVEALLELRSVALAARERTGADPFTLENLVHSARNETEEARLRALLARARAGTPVGGDT